MREDTTPVRVRFEIQVFEYIGPLVELSCDEGSGSVAIDQSGIGFDDGAVIRLQLDDRWVAAHGLEYVVRLTCDGDGGEKTTTGWIVFALDTGVLAPGSHVLRVGAYVNKKTAADEILDLLIDEVEVSGFARDD